MPHRTAQLIHKKVLAANKILLVPHRNPDGDTLGSVTALIDYLRTHEKPYAVFCATEAPESLSHLHYFDEIISDPRVWQDPAIDLVILCDSSDPSYAGVNEHLAAREPKPFVINIDHHATNKLYGDLNLVITTAASTTEILYQYFRTNHIEFTDRMATSLLTGIITDTDHFTNAATSPSAMQFASDLIRRGGRLEHILSKTLRNKTVDKLKVWGNALSRLTHHEPTGLVYTFFTQKDIAGTEMEGNSSEGLANFFNSLGEGKASLVLTEQADGTVKGSFRTTRNDIDVSAWATKLGGGGHKKAAGFTVPGPIDKSIEQVLLVAKSA